jgi:hypothetical protein
MADVIRFAEEPSPSGDGLSVPDQGDNPASNDYKPEDSGDLFSDVGGDSSGDGGGSIGGGGGGGMGPDEPDAENPDAESPDQSKSYVQNFVEMNIDTYNQLTKDIEHVLQLDKNEISHGDGENYVDGVLNKLLEMSWSISALDDLSFGNIGNIKSYIMEIMQKDRNTFVEKDLFPILDKIRGGNTSMAGKIKLVMANGKVQKQVVDGAGNEVSVSEAIASVKEKLAKTLVKTRYSIKGLKLNLNAAHGLLSKRNKFAAEGEESDEAGIEDMQDLDSDLADQTEEFGNGTDTLSEDIKQLSNEIRELTKIVKEVAGGGELTKSEDDEIAGLLEDGKGTVDEGVETLEEAEELENEIKASFSKKIIKKSEKESATEEKKEEKAEEKAEMKEKKSFFSKFKKSDSAMGTEGIGNGMGKADLGAQPVPGSMVPGAGEEVSNESEVTPEKIMADVSQGIIPSNNWGFSDLGEVAKAMGDKAYAFVSSAIEALSGGQASEGMPIAAGSAQNIKTAKYTEIYEDIKQTSKVQDAGGVDSVAEELNKNFSSENKKHTTESNQFPKNFATEYGTASPSMGSMAKDIKASTNTGAGNRFSELQKLKIRKAFEVAFEQQFKQMIENPLAASVADKFVRAGSTENQAVQNTFDAFADSFEDTVKVAVRHAMEYVNYSDEELLRKAKDVSSHQIDLFDGSEGPEGEVVAESTETLSAGKRNPVIKTSSVDEGEQLNAILNSMVQR